MIAALGCGASATAPPPEQPLSSDAQVLQALEAYEPTYRLDEDGRVTKLRIIWRDVPDDVAAQIGKLTELIGVDLVGTTIGDSGLAQLKDLQKLRSMGLGNTNVTDAGLVELAKLRSLERVWMSKNRVTPEAVESLKELHPGLTVYLH
jgi:hypothetical protein